MRTFTKSAPRLAALFLCVLLCVANGRAEKKTGPAGAAQAIQVQVEMVSLPVVVTDQAGNHVRDLKKEDFQVFEDGVLQEIAGFAAVEEPISVALTLDTSGSTEFQLDRIAAGGHAVRETAAR